MSFLSDIAKFRRKVDRNADTVVAETTILVAQGVILKSPVDTGRFRGNWMFGVGQINESTTDDTDPSGQSTLTKLSAAIRRAGSNKLTFITNSLPYAPRLEDGWSKQAPSGMVALTVREFQDYVNMAIRQIQK